MESTDKKLLEEASNLIMKAGLLTLVDARRIINALDKLDDPVLEPTEKKNIKNIIIEYISLAQNRSPFTLKDAATLYQYITDSN